VPDPAPFRASWETFASLVPGLNWLTLARLRAKRATWVINLCGLGIIIGSMHALTVWTNSLRKHPPAPIQLGSFALSGNALQWIVTGFGLYVMLNWLQVLRLRDKPCFAIIAQTPSLILLFTIAALQSIVNYSIMGWSPAFLIKTYHLTATQVGAVFGPLAAGIGVVGPMIAGPLSDWLNARFRSGRMYITLGALTLSPFIGWFVYHANTPGEFYAAFTIYSLSLTMWLPPLYAAFMDLALPRMRGSVVSFYILTMTIFGLGLGPYTVGLISDLNGGNLGAAILSIYWVGPFIVALVLALIWVLPKDEATVISRAQAAGEPI